MIFKNYTYDEIEKSNKKIVIWGGGGTSKYLINFLNDSQKYCFFNKSIAIISNKALNGKFKIEYNGCSRYIISINDFLNENNNYEDCIFLLCSNYFVEIFYQLEEISELKNTECCIPYLIMNKVPEYNLTVYSESDVPKIPKKIHYCWVGNNPIPDFNKKCIESWYKYMPDYEIIRHDETNYDFSKNQYMYDAYKSKRWGFVPDYARLDIIYNEGGIYFDTDVEAVKNFDDLLYDKAFCGWSYGAIAMGLGFGAIKHFSLIKELRDIYNEAVFINKQEILQSYDTCYYVKSVLENKYYFDYSKNKKLAILNEMKIYPADVLAPLNWDNIPLNFTNNTHSIHWFDASWFDEDHLIKFQERKDKIKNFFNIIDK